MATRPDLSRQLYSDAHHRRTICRRHLFCPYLARRIISLSHSPVLSKLIPSTPGDRSPRRWLAVSRRVEQLLLVGAEPWPHALLTLYTLGTRQPRKTGLVPMPDDDVDLANLKHPSELELHRKKGPEFRSPPWKTNGRSRARRIAPRRPPVPFPSVLEMTSVSSRLNLYRDVGSVVISTSAIVVVSDCPLVKETAFALPSNRDPKLANQPPRHHCTPQRCSALSQASTSSKREVVLGLGRHSCVACATLLVVNN